MQLLDKIHTVFTAALRYRTPSGSGKYIRFGLRIEIGANRTTIVDVFDVQ